VYTAFVGPKGDSIVVWRAGAPKPTATFKDLNVPGSAVATNGPKNRIWLFWRDRNGWHATRSSKAVTHWEPQSVVAAPKNWEPNIFTAANGSQGPLVAVVTMTSPSPGNVNEVRDILIRPRLSISAAPTVVKRGHAFTVHVTDAGDGLIASVHFAGKKVPTNKQGYVTLTVPNSLSLGRHAVTATVAGYIGAGTRIRVTK
jgi:hypothetical protein